MKIVDNNNSGKIDYSGRFSFINILEWVMATIDRDKFLSKDKL